jgi:hypothetical protein
VATTYRRASPSIPSVPGNPPFDGCKTLEKAYNVIVSNPIQITRYVMKPTKQAPKKPEAGKPAPAKPKGGKGPTGKKK